MLKTVRWLMKAIVASVLALAIASAVCLVYYNPGIRSTNKTGVTDFVWQSNHFTCTMTEGIAWNRTDKNGFYNKECIDKNMDILVMGSSQMEGTNVLAEQKMPWLLGELTEQTVYNVGISSHALLTYVKNLEAALTVMAPTKYVIFEIGTTVFAEKDIQECLAGEMQNMSSYDSGFLYHLQKIPYLKLLYAQIKSWNGVEDNNTPTQTVEQTAATDNAISPAAYERLLERIHNLCAKHNVQPIILYHPRMHLNADGTASANIDETSLAALQSACQANNVLLVDMTEDFLNLYATDHVLPRGFCNTSVGVGHLNKHGHKAIAERLAQTIENFEKDEDK